MRKPPYWTESKALKSRSPFRALMSREVVPILLAYHRRNKQAVTCVSAIHLGVYFPGSSRRPIDGNLVTALSRLASGNILKLLIYVSFSMPRNRKQKSKSTRKGRGRVTRKTYRGMPNSTGRPGLTIVPGSGFQSDAERVTLRFVDTVTIAASSASGQYLTQNYGVNSPRVPEQSTMTGQSQGWTQLAAMYQRYVCYGSKINWEITMLKPAANASSQGMLVGAVAPWTGLGSAITTITDWSAQKYVRRHNFPPQVLETGTPTMGMYLDSPLARWRGTANMAVGKLLGETNLRQSLYEAATSANPTILPLWVFAFQDVLADAVYKPRFLMRVEVQYDVLFFGRSPIGNTLVCCETKTTPPSGVREEKKSPSPTETVDRYTLVDIEELPLRKELPTASPQVRQVVESLQSSPPRAR